MRQLSGQAPSSAPPASTMSRRSPACRGRQKFRRKNARKSCWPAGGPGLLPMSRRRARTPRIQPPRRRGRRSTMNTLARVSGVAVSALTAATATVLLLLPGRAQLEYPDATVGASARATVIPGATATPGATAPTQTGSHGGSPASEQAHGLTVSGTGSPSGLSATGGGPGCPQGYRWRQIDRGRRHVRHPGYPRPGPAPPPGWCCAPQR